MTTQAKTRSKFLPAPALDPEVRPARGRVSTHPFWRLQALLAQAADLGATHLQVHVLAVMATYDDPSHPGRCWPRMTTLAQKCGYAAPSEDFYRALRALEAKPIAKVSLERKQTWKNRKALVGFRILWPVSGKAANPLAEKPRPFVSGKAASLRAIREGPVKDQNEEKKTERAATSRSKTSSSGGSKRETASLSPAAQEVLRGWKSVWNPQQVRDGLDSYGPQDMTDALAWVRDRSKWILKQSRKFEIGGYLTKILKNGSVPRIAKCWRARKSAEIAGEADQAAFERCAARAAACDRIEDELAIWRDEEKRLKESARKWDAEEQPSKSRKRHRVHLAEPAKPKPPAKKDLDTRQDEDPDDLKTDAELIRDHQAKKVRESDKEALIDMYGDPNAGE